MDGGQCAINPMQYLLVITTQQVLGERKDHGRTQRLTTYIVVIK